MTQPLPRLSTLVGLPFFAAVSVIVVFGVCVGIINGLPRVQQGEAVLTPWPFCSISSVAAAFTIPWVVSMLAIRQKRLKFYFTVCLLVIVAVGFRFVFWELLSEAYFRGL